MSRPDPRAGFTLIEVLAALAITAALVSVALPFATRLATRWWVGEHRVEIADGWMQGVARLGDDLSEAIPIPVRTGPTFAAAFIAGPDFVQFVRPALGVASSSELQSVRYEIRPSATGTRLVRRAASFSAEAFNAPMTGDPEGTTILEGPARLAFAILDKDQKPHPLWTAGRQMPTGVELSVTATPRDWISQSPIRLPIVARTFALTGP